MDLASGTLVRARVAWPEDHGPDLAPFDVVEAVLADDPERDDLAQPESVTVEGCPGTSAPSTAAGCAGSSTGWPPRSRSTCSGFPGASAPYWEFRGFRPSLALLVPTKGPVLFRRTATGRCGSASAGAAATTGSRWRTPGPSGPWTWPGGTACRQGPGRGPRASSPTTWWRRSAAPRAGHCYKTVRAILPRG